MANPVFDAMISHLTLERDIGGYTAEAQAHAAIDDFYPAMADLLGANPKEIAFAPNHTRAWETGLRSIDWQEGDRLLINDNAYSPNYLAFLHLVKTRGIVLDRLPSTENGLIDENALPAHVHPRTKAVALTHMPTFDGTIQPAQAVGKWAKAQGLIYILDACQSVGQYAINVKEIGCDILAGTGRKWLRGPRGTGFLYVANSCLSKLTPPLIDNISATQTGTDRFEWAAGAKRFETYERHVAGQIGLGVAARYAAQIGMENIQSRVESLAKTLRESLSTLPEIEVLESGDHLSGIVTFHCKEREQKAVIEPLWKDKIAVSFVSPEFALFKFKSLNCAGAIRASLHYYNTEEEIERFIKALKRILS
jgi:selenocysteine lyase/cysteine desulfurase